MKSDGNLLKALWKAGFNDTDDYINLFFKMLYKKGNAVYKKQGEEIISALYLLPFNMSFNGYIVKTAYLCGAATLPEYRGKGLMSELMNTAIKRLADDNIPFCTLIPANEGLFDYYSRFGFADIYKTKKIRVKREEFDKKSLITFDKIDNAKEITDLYNNEIGRKDFAHLRTKEYFEFLLKEAELLNGKVLKIIKNNEFCGYMFCFCDFIKEFVLKNITFDEYAAAAFKYLKMEELEFVTPFDFSYEDGAVKRAGMLRIIDCEKVLNLWAEKMPQKSHIISVADKQIEKNNGVFKIEKGKVSRTDEKAEVKTDIKDLANMIADSSPYINLSLN